MNKRFRSYGFPLPLAIQSLREVVIVASNIVIRIY
jgi:hypothetical protein